MVINHSIQRKRSCHGAQNTPDAPKTFVASSWNNSWRICRCLEFFPNKGELLRRKVIFYLIKGLKCYTFDSVLVVIHFARTGVGGVALPCFPFVYHRSEIIAKKKNKNKRTAFTDPLFPAFCEEINVCWGGDSLLQDEDGALINEGM